MKRQLIYLMAAAEWQLFVRVNFTHLIYLTFRAQDLFKFQRAEKEFIIQIYQARMGCESSSSIDASYPASPNQQRMNSKVAKLKPSELLSQTENLIKNKQFSEAAKIYRKYIQENINDQVEIDGMGNLQQAVSYYEWFKFPWYLDGITKGIYKGTVYDFLFLCQLELKNNEDQMEEAIDWYRSMIDLYADKYQILYGYANILYSKAIYEQAIDFYKRVIEKKPEWLMPYQNMAFIYEYKRVQLAKANEYANSLLKMEPNNRVAMFILARNEKDIEKKIQKLKETSAAHPLYARVINEIGIVYGGTKKEYRQAIEWYKKCIEVAPPYASCYNNVGVNHELLKEYDEAIVWYFRAIQKDKQYKAPHTNLSDCFDTLNYTDQDIIQKMALYKIQIDYFYYYLGLAYYDKKKQQKSLSYYQLAEEKAALLKKDINKLYNSIGITYDQMGKYSDAVVYYTKCIQLNPKYHSAYYNTAIVYKNQNNIPQAISWYKKAIQANHRYSYAYNNLGNIYKNQYQNYEQAIKNYKKAVEHLSTYTLAYANMGICYLKLQNYRDAFNAISRANQLLPTDNNNLSSANKIFLKDTLKQFQVQGQRWRENGGITSQMRQKLAGMIKSFQANFKVLYQWTSGVTVAKQKIFRKDVSEIIKLVYDAKFQLTNIDKIYDLVKSAFQDNQEYFHILPQLFLQYFINHTFTNNIPILQSENQLQQVVKRLSAKTVASQPKPKNVSADAANKVQFKLTHFNPPSDCKVNLFQNGKFFQDYAELYSEIMQVNKVAVAYYKPFKDMVDNIRKQSYGIPYGVGLKIPSQQQNQFKVILRIYEKMFKKEINGEKVKQIIMKIQDELLKKKSAQNSKIVGFGDVVSDIMTVWTSQITQIVKKRKKNNIPTQCEISDLLRGKIMFVSVDRLKKALQITDELCHQHNYQIIEMDNRLTKPQTQDVVLKIKISSIVCELQLAMQQDETQYHFVHSIYEIERSPLGCIFGSYIYLSKKVNYHVLKNCEDIVTVLNVDEQAQEGEKAQLRQAAQYIVSCLKQS